MSQSKKKKTYSVPPDLQMNPHTSSWFSAPLYPNLPIGEGIEPVGETFDINMPIHPDYMEVLQPDIRVGDLVETHNGKMGIVVSINKPQGIFITIKNANNKYYVVLIGDKEEKYIGYSLKKLDNQNQT